MPEPPQLVPLDVEEQRHCSELSAGDQTRPTISTGALSALSSQQQTGKATA